VGTRFSQKQRDHKEIEQAARLIFDLACSRRSPIKNARQLVELAGIYYQDSAGR
jgi:hypothetical protein